MKNLWNRLPTVMGVVLVELIARVAALCPLVLAFVDTRLKFAGKDSVWIWCALSVILYALIVMPARSQGYTALRRCTGGKVRRNVTWMKRVRLGLIRLARGTAWGIPFWVLVIYFIWGYNAKDSKNLFFGPLMDLGALVAREGESTIDKGIILYLSVTLFAGIVYALGWWLDTASDYLDPSGREIFRAGRKLMREHFGKFCLTAFTQGLLLLPAVALILGILFMYFKGQVSFENGAFAALNGLMRSLRKPLPGSVNVYLGAAFLIVHVPLCVIRKARMSALVCALEKDA